MKCVKCVSVKSIKFHYLKCPQEAHDVVWTSLQRCLAVNIHSYSPEFPLFEHLAAFYLFTVIWQLMCFSFVQLVWYLTSHLQIVEKGSQRSSRVVFTISNMFIGSNNKQKRTTMFEGQIKRAFWKKALNQHLF